MNINYEDLSIDELDEIINKANAQKKYLQNAKIDELILNFRKAFEALMDNYIRVTYDGFIDDYDDPTYHICCWEDFKFDY